MLSSGSLGYFVRGDALPINGLPKYWDVVSRTKLTLNPVLQPMVGLSIGVGPTSLEKYLDWEVLSKAYADAYRLLFVRAMVDVLDHGETIGRGYKSSKSVTGRKQITIEALVLEPAFVHVVVGFLAVISIATVALLILSITRERCLRTDPSTLAGIMALVAHNQPLLSDFADLDCCTMADVQTIVGQKRYKLVNDGLGTRQVATSSPKRESSNLLPALKKLRTMPL